jgi:type II secretory pathway pseudopilin PulG
MVCGKLHKNLGFQIKRGFGIVEVMVAAVVLGFLYMAVMNLQAGNHDALLRIRGRDGATEVAQNIIDSLGALGIASLSTENNDKLIQVHDNATDETYWTLATSKGKPDTIKVNRKWRGQPGIIENTMAVDYDVVVKVSPDTAYMAKTTSKYLEMDNDTIRHVYAKRLDVKVLWCFKCSNSEPNQSITVSGVVK